MLWRQTGLGSSVYLFPPVNLIPQLLQRLLQFQGRAILVALWTPQAPWLPVLLQHCWEHLHLWTTVFQTCLNSKVTHSSHSSDHWTGFLFLRSLLSRRYPAPVIESMLHSYRHSSTRQHEVAWKALQTWLPADFTTLSKETLLPFFIHLFEEKKTGCIDNTELLSFFVLAITGGFWY